MIFERLDENRWTLIWSFPIKQSVIHKNKKKKQQEVAFNAAKYQFSYSEKYIIKYINIHGKKIQI